METDRIAVVGAGMAGLAAAARLRQAGCSVTVLERAPAIGGRMASVWSDGGAIDHGALYVTVRDPAFQEAMQAAVFGGHGTGWAPRGRATDEPWIIGLPDMRGLLRPLLDGVAIFLDLQVERIGQATEGYTLRTQTGSVGPFDGVVVAVPAPEALPLLQSYGKPFDALESVGMRPTLVALATFPGRLDIADDYLPGAGILELAARNSSKAGRGDGEFWILHGAHDWSEARLNTDPDAAAGELIAAFGNLADAELAAPVWQSLHAWRYSFVETPLGAPYLLGANRRIAACGDWCLGPRAEAAFLSGRAAAEALIE
ncbi:MAG TPA: FAD-dependent oxidoreductase [Afifellaceae bacterium]|nr:FAD-dependent oxidoreductase [Afifellaceae bacterium]